MLRVAWRSLLVTVSLVNFAAAIAFGQDSFYKGKTIRFIVGAPPGGGFDA